MLEVSPPIRILNMGISLTCTTKGSAWVTLDNVKVPVENLVGKENKGFLALMSSKCTFRAVSWAFFVLSILIIAKTSIGNA